MTGRLALAIAALTTAAGVLAAGSLAARWTVGRAAGGQPLWTRPVSTAPAAPPAAPLPAALPLAAEGSQQPPDLAFAAGAHFAYILAAQRPSGAIAITPGGEAINPYFANIAARALLLRGEAYLAAVERWLQWYLGHLNADGSIDDYRVRDGQEVATGHYDSADSYAATFLSLVAAYLDAGGDPRWVERSRPELDRVAGLVERLTDADGLVWAKPYYPLKLLMDNAEVYQGWMDWARVLEAMAEPEAAVAARERAAGIRDGLERFRLDDGTYAWGLAPFGIRRGGNLKRFYPDAVAQFMPFAFGVTHAVTGWEQFSAAHPDWTDLERDRFPWLMAAYVAHRAGDVTAAETALANAAGRFGDFRYPWYIAESAWALHLLERGA